MKNMDKIKRIKIITEALEQLDADLKSFPQDYSYSREEVNEVQKLYASKTFDKLAKLCEEISLSEDLIDLVTYMIEFSKEEQEAYLNNLEVFLEEPFYSQIETLKIKLFKSSTLNATM